MALQQAGTASDAMLGPPEGGAGTKGSRARTVAVLRPRKGGQFL